MTTSRQTSDVATSSVLAALAQLEQDEAATVAAYDAALAALPALVECLRSYERSVEQLLNEAGAARASGTLPGGAVFNGSPHYNIDPHRSVLIGGRTIGMESDVAARGLDGLIVAVRSRAGVHPVSPGRAMLGPEWVDGLRRYV